MGNCNKKTKNTGGGVALRIDVDNNTTDNTNNNQRGDGQYDHLYKILLIGDQGVGKTSLILRYSEEKFSDATAPTIGGGVDFKMRTINVNSKVVKLQLWDTAGQEQFRTISSTYYRGAHAIILAYSIDDLESFENIKRQWKEEVDRYSNSNCARIIVGCKSDLKDKRAVTKEQVQSLSAELNMEHVELSSKSGTAQEIDTPFRKLVTLLLEEQ